MRILGPMVELLAEGSSGGTGAGPLLKSMGVIGVERGDLAAGADIDVLTRVISSITDRF